MSRANRNFCKGHVWHLTHRCHQRTFLLRFARDRRRWRHWLFEAKRRFGLSVLNYVATSNHVHLLCADQGKEEITRSMQLIAGRTAQEYNMRKDRKGAFWEDRYHATAVQTDEHLARCITYIDLNMVRAGAVKHPCDWQVSGYNEIQTPWQRKQVIDFNALTEYFGVSNRQDLAILQERWLQEEIATSRREPAWSESIAVGNEAFLDALQNDMGTNAAGKQVVTLGGFNALQSRTSH